MMTDNGLLWILIGAATAGVSLFSQQWSVNRLDPQKASRSLCLIVGGAILRWVLFTSVFIVSMKQSYKALLLFVIAFLIVRFVFLLKWQGLLQLKNPFIRQP